MSVLVNSGIGGAPIPAYELLSCFSMLGVLGNETTRNALSGGLLVLIGNPGEMEKLRENMEITDKATEGIVRWTSLVIQFCRTPVEDFEMQGSRVRACETLCLFYPSANRDAEVLGKSDEFHVDRSPNRYVAR